MQNYAVGSEIGALKTVCNLIFCRLLSFSFFVCYAKFAGKLRASVHSASVFFLFSFRKGRISVAGLRAQSKRKLAQKSTFVRPDAQNGASVAQSDKGFPRTVWGAVCFEKESCTPITFLTVVKLCYKAWSNQISPREHGFSLYALLPQRKIGIQRERERGRERKIKREREKRGSEKKQERTEKRQYREPHRNLKSKVSLRDNIYTSKSKSILV